MHYPHAPVIPRCYVFLDDPSALGTDMGKIAHLVASTLSRPLPDVLTRVRYGRGILVRDANPAQARLLGRAAADPQDLPGRRGALRARLELLGLQRATHHLDMRPGL